MDGSPKFDKATKRAFNGHVRAAKAAEAESSLVEALEEYTRALTIYSCSHPALEKKIASLKNKIADEKKPQNTCADDELRSSDRPETLQPTFANAGNSIRSSASEEPLIKHCTSDNEAVSIANTPSPMRLPGGFTLDASIACRLFEHQKEGVAWLWSLHHSQLSYPPQHHAAAAIDKSKASISGGCLADDSKFARASTSYAALPFIAYRPRHLLVVGLGKTFQCIAFIAGLFSSRKARCALIVAPISVLPVWESEFHKWAPSVHVVTLHGKRSARTVPDLVHRGGVLLTSYGMCASDPGALGASRTTVSPGADASTAPVEWEPAPPPGSSASSTSSCPWDICVLDEGHKIKNPQTLVHKAMQAIPSSYRLLLSGTPIQNNLDELWALCDYFTWGTLLGTRRTFGREIANRIVAGRDRHATLIEQRDGETAARLLMELLRPHLLRREKSVLLRGEGEKIAVGCEAVGPLQRRQHDVQDATVDETSSPVARIPSLSQLGAKKEVILWCPTFRAQARPPPPPSDAHESPV
jgi:DNA excision repair protein ERCC-6-like